MQRRLNCIATLTCLLLTATASTHEMPGGLLIHLPFDGSLANHGSMPASAQLIIAGGEPAGRSPEFREGRFGKAMYFPGDVAVRIPVDIGHELYPEITLTAWVYLEDSASGYVITNRSASGPSIRVSGSYVAAIGPRVEFNENVGTGRWTFVAGVWDRNTSTLRFHYGRRSGTRDMTDRKVAGQISTWVGAWDDTLQSVLTNALVDDVRVYDSALTPEQIEGLWLGTEVAATTSPTIASEEMVVRETPDLTGPDGAPQVSGTISAPAEELAEDVAEAEEATPTQWSVATPEYEAQVEGEFMVLDPDASSGDADSSNQVTDQRTASTYRFSQTEAMETGVSGDVGGIREVLEAKNPDTSAFTSFHAMGIKERMDVPCSLYFYSEDPLLGDGKNFIRRCDTFNNIPDLRPSLPTNSVNSLTVCTNNKANKRVKGLRVGGFEIQDDGTLGNYFTDSEKLPNCAEWKQSVNCEEGYAATGIVAYFNDKGAAATADELVGLGLICRKIEVIYE